MEREFTTHAAVVLLIAFAISITYELFRAIARKNISAYDNLKNFAKQGLPLYLSGGAVIMVLLLNYDWSNVVGLIYCLILILVAVLYYNPRVMPARQPGFIDWLENALYGGLLFSALTILIYSVV